ncbi:MAG: hypothetical protein M3552_07655, partial [Planctomycetota bacterium]|nr:hypothetical protein [Planctomycetota bacterium]
MAESELRRAIEQGQAAGELTAALARLGNYELRSEEEALAVAELVANWPEWESTRPSPFPAALGFFQQVETGEAFATLVEYGLPHVRNLFDAIYKQPPSPQRTEELLFATKILVLYHDPSDLPRIAAAAWEPSLDHESLWSVIFQSIGEGYPLQRELVEALREPLPDGGAAIAYLDFVNAIAIETPLPHPFDTLAGHAMLESWLAED